MKHIFIGGTGRSGTTVVLHVLSYHPQLYTLPMEMKFITQVDGLCSLVQRMSGDYTMTDGALALERFRRLMYDVLTHRGENPYADLADEPYGRLEFLPQDIIPDYFSSLDRFFAQVDSRYHPRDVMVGHARSLIDCLFEPNAVSRGACGWVEKTPANFARIDSLFEIYPDALFINCVRDPRGVVHSFMRRKWTLDSLEGAARYFAAYYEYLSSQRAFGLARPTQYHELRLELLVADPAGEMERVLRFLDVDGFSEERNEFLTTTLRQGSMRWAEEQGRYCDAWETAYSDKEKALLGEILADAISFWDYE